MPVLVCALDGASPTEEDLRRLVPGLTAATRTRHLKRLEANRVLVVKDGRYVLTERERELAEIARAVVGWESGGRSGGERAGASAVRLLIDKRICAVIFALGDKSLRPEELGPHVPDVKHGTLMRDLDLLAGEGVVSRRRHTRRHVDYELTPTGRALALPGVLAERWNWSWARASGGADVAGLIRMLAPEALVEPWRHGSVHVHVDDAPATHAHDVLLGVRGGRLTVLASAPTDPPAAYAHARARAWCDALVTGDRSGIAIEGEGDLLCAVLAALGSALRSAQR